MSKLPLALVASAIIWVLGSSSFAADKGASNQSAASGASISAPTGSTDTQSNNSKPPPAQNESASGATGHEETAQMPADSDQRSISTKKEIQKRDNDAGVEQPGVGAAGPREH